VSRPAPNQRPAKVRSPRARRHTPRGVAARTPELRAPAARDTVHANVYAAMKQALMRGQYQPGQKITIRGVAAALGTSATPVREAIRRLAAEGALEHLRSGTARLPALTRERLSEVTDVRVALESLAAGHAALRMTGDDIAHLEAIQVALAKARDRKDYETYLAKNEAFHFDYYRCSRMPNLLRAIESMWLQSGPYLSLLLPGMRGIDLHTAAIEAARRHDGPAAAAAIAEDIRRAAERLATLVPESGAESGDAGTLRPRETA
jgi:DNA-binding GntR family transcriptional regulator